MGRLESGRGGEGEEERAAKEGNKVSAPNRISHLALLTNHVVATLVLLDPREALGALLRVGKDPVGGLTFVLALLLPLGKVGANNWRVGLETATDAEVMAAVALDVTEPSLGAAGRAGTSEAGRCEGAGRLAGESSENSDEEQKEWRFSFSQHSRHLHRPIDSHLATLLQPAPGHQRASLFKST
jgi:hypothetical protein